MLSHIVTAAKGLFSTQDIAEEDSSSSPHDQGSTVLPERPKVMVSTRRTRYGTADAEDSSNTGTSSIGSGKRKSASNTPNGLENQKKKRKTGPNGGSDIAVVVDNMPNMQRNRTLNGDEGSSEEDRASVASADADPQPSGDIVTKSTHVRFGSEEPIAISEEDADANPETKDPEVDNGSSDDDEAPETLDNATQLAKVKAAMQNAEQAKLRYDIFPAMTILRLLITSLDTKN